MENQFGEPVKTTPDEEHLLQSVKALFNSKSDYGEGAEFRVAFLSEVMDGYCDACGRKCDFQCHCRNDD